MATVCGRKDCLRCGGRRIYGYHTADRGDKIHSPNERNPVYFGIENELYYKDYQYNGNCIAKLVQKSFDKRGLHVCIEYDDSIGNGFEIITQPMSYKAMVDHNFFSVYWDLRKYMRTTGTGAGMHIHMSVDHLTCIDVAKIVTFYNNNHRFIEKICNRRATGYCPHNAQNINDVDYFLLRYERAGKSYDSERGQLNLNRRNRIEFRGFKSTVRPERVLKNVQHLMFLTEFVKNHEFADMTKEKYIEVLSATPERAYLELKIWLRLYNNAEIFISKETTRQVLSIETIQ